MTRSFALVLFVPLAMLGCEAAQDPIRQTDAPSVYLVLSATPSVTDDDSALYALVATAEASPKYLYPTRFDLRAVGSAISFNWLEHPRTAPPGIGAGVPIRFVGNLRLPWSNSALGLGRESLTPGEYELHIEVDGYTITGKAAIPRAPLITTAIVDGEVQKISWENIPGHTYRLYVETDVPALITTRDTFYVIQRNQGQALVPPDPVFGLTVVDTAFDAYEANPANSSFGLSGAYGLFLGVSQQRVALSPSSASKDPPRHVGPRFQRSLKPGLRLGRN